MKLSYGSGLLVVQTDSKLSKHIEFSLLWQSTSGSNRFETFETHRIHLKIPNSASQLVIRTDSKLSKHIEFM